MNKVWFESNSHRAKSKQLFGNIKMNKAILHLIFNRFKVTFNNPFLLIRVKYQHIKSNIGTSRCTITYQQVDYDVEVGS